jgi:hypothetical protein
MFKALLATAITLPIAGAVAVKSVPHPKPLPSLKSPEWTCPDCTPSEKYVLREIQRKTKIRDKNVLSTILGNIKQESNFHSNICEGGARVPYSDCHRGGYGLIQWTSENRYLGLGEFAKKYKCDESTLECQTRYMINESQFQDVLPDFEGYGHTIAQYMKPAYRWLGWGIKGNREKYAYEYSKKLRLEFVV